MNPTELPSLSVLTPAIDMIRRRLRKMKSPEQAAAAAQWLDRHEHSSSLQTLARLAADWAYLGKRHGPGANPQMYFSLFGQLAQLSAEDLPSPLVVRYLARSLRRFPMVAPWEELVATVSKPGGTKLDAAAWKKHHRGFRVAEDERLAAQATFDSLHGDLRRFGAFLRVSMPELPLRQTKLPLDGVTAWTDGKTITLPEAIAVSEHAELNQWSYFWLLAHEYEHYLSGSFEFRFDTPEGQALWARLAPRREIFRQNRLVWNGQAVLERLLAAGDKVGSSFQPFLPHLRAFTMHFANQEGAHGMVNLIDDVRIEKALVHKYPALAEIARIIRDYEEFLRPHPRFLSSSDNFFNALFCRSQNLRSSGYVARSFIQAWERVGLVLDAWREGPLGTMADSLRTTLDILEILEQELPPKQFEGLNQQFSRQVSVAIEDIAFRQRWLSAEENDPNQPGRKGNYPGWLETRPEGPGPFYIYPEWNVWDSAFESEAVWVTEQPWQPWRKPHRLKDRGGGGRFVLPRTTDFSKHRSRPNSEGVDLDLARLHDHLVARRAGREADERVFHGAVSGESASWTVSFVVDLTVSLEAPRNRSAELPLVRAIQVIQSLLPPLQDADVPTAVFGVHDAGRRPVTFYVAKSYHEPVSLDTIGSLHAIGVGGFRHGAVIRHLGTRLAREFPGRKNAVVLLTDAASHYQAAGMDDYLRTQLLKGHCANCQARARCPIEPLLPQTSARRISANQPDIYYPTYYESADLQRALAAHANIEPLLVLLDTGYSEKFLDRMVGRDHWTSLLSQADECDLSGKLSSLLSFDGPTKTLRPPLASSELFSAHHEPPALRTPRQRILQTKTLSTPSNQVRFSRMNLKNDVSAAGI